jgi:hypothetical protein
MPINMYFKKFVKPTAKEGFAEVKEVELVGGPFDSPEDEEMFYSFVYS